MEVKLPIYPGNKANIVGYIEVKVGDHIKEGELLTNIETGKGSRDLLAKVSGVIKDIKVNPGDHVIADQVLFVIAEEEDSETEVNELTAKENPSTASIVKENKVGTAEKEITTDLVVIGAGPGGYVTAIYAAKAGLDVTLIEEADLGGTCLNFGCIPTKAIQKVAHLYDELNEASKLGINIKGEVDFDYNKVMAYKDDIVANLVSGVDYLIEKNVIRLIKAHASFIDENTIKAGSSTIKAKNIIIATGAKLSRLDVPGKDLAGVMTAKEALSNTDFPSSVTIIGGGVIGMEFAFMYRQFGAEVNVLTHREQILRGTDRDAAAFIEKKAKSMGIGIHFYSPISSITKAINGQLITNFSQEGVEKSVVSDRVIMTTGTPINIDGLGLEKAGVKLNAYNNGIEVNDFMQTSVDHIYAIGDVNNIFKLAHVASQQGIIAVDHIIDETKAHPFDISLAPHIVYTYPEIASVGYTSEMLDEKAIEYTSEIMDFAAIGKALIDSEDEGFIKVNMDKNTHEVLGAVIVGKDVSNLISDFTLARSHDLTIDDIAATIYSHPTTSEIIHEIALKLTGFGIHD